MNFVSFIVYASFILAMSKEVSKNNDDFILPALLEDYPIESTLRGNTSEADSQLHVSVKPLKTSNVVDIVKEKKNEGNITFYV